MTSLSRNTRIDLRLFSEKMRPANLFLFALTLFALVYISNFKTDFHGAKSVLQAHDIDAYLAIANSAPAFPSEQISGHYAERFLLHYCIGLIHVSTGFSLLSLYQWANALIFIGIIGLFCKIFLVLALSEWAAATGLALLIFNPFFGRQYFAVPVLTSDLLCTFGCCMAFLGLLQTRWFLIALGLFLGAIGKQSVMLVLPGFIYWIYATYRETKSKNTLIILTVSVLLPVIAAKVILHNLSSGWSFPVPIIDLLYIAGSRKDLSLIGSWPFYEHLMKTIVPIIPAIPFLRSFEGQFKPFSKINLVLILVASCLIMQPVLFHPKVLSNNEPRLGSFIVPWVSLLIAYNSRVFCAENKRFFFASLILLFCGSFHHQTTVFGLSKIQFGAVLGVMTVLDAIVIELARRKSPFSNKAQYGNQ